MKLPAAALAFVLAMSLIYIAGCGSDSTTSTPTLIDNPNVRSYDSVGVDEDVALGSFAGIVIVNGTTTTNVSPDRDVSLADSGSSGKNFFLRSGVLLNKLDAGYETRFFLVRSDITPAQFDTMSAVYDNIGSALDTLDFTQDETWGSPSVPWGYFNAPLSGTPVYCFWLKGRKTTSTKNIFGIIQPREATDSSPSTPGNFRMSFRFRININGENDFRKKIQQQ